VASKTPKFLGPDGVYRETYLFTTDISSRFFTGSMDSDTVDMQVSVRGAAFSSSPDLILFEGTSFSIPNPSAYPDGLQLYPGDNIIEVKAILFNGEVTAPGVIQATLSLERDQQVAVIAPSGVFVERFDRYIKITVEGLDDPNVVGYNFYASVSPGGGTTGYRQINPAMVITGDTAEEVTSLGEMTVDASIALSGGVHAADPMYLNFIGTQINQFGTVLQTDFNQSLAVPDTTDQVRALVQVSSVRQVQRFSFIHDRRSNASSAINPAIPNAEFSAIPDTDPLYYAVAAVYLIDASEYESSLSPELAASPLIVTPALTTLPVVSRQQIVRDTTLSIFRSHPEVDIKPGSVLRDTYIDPFSTEAERIRFIVGFLQACQSFATLLSIADPNNSGVSIPVNQSAYKLALKQAFFLKDDQAVQNLIDNCFDQLAARYGVTRSSGTRARGEVTLYVSARPTTTKPIPIGTLLIGGGIRFRTTSAAQISPTGAGSSYDPNTGHYYTRAFIQAESTGSSGNVTAGQIRTVSGISGVLALNEGSTFGGADSESNRALAARATGVLSAVDSGTYRGYTQKAIQVSGVQQANEVESSHGLMYRDYDPSTGKHTGGKVDIWLRGGNPTDVTDSFAFSFELVLNGQFEPVGDLSDLRFRAVNSALTTDNPIIEMISQPDWGYGFVNITTGQVLDTTNATLITPDGIQLDPDYNDPTNLHITDEYRGTYRYRTSNKHVFFRQPVDVINSLVGGVTGSVSPSIYMLFHGSDPLLLGRSTESGDYVQVVQTTDITIPSGTPIVITDERHTLLGGIEYLFYLGANPLTVRVYNLDRSVEYVGPYHPSGTADFSFEAESGEIPLGIRLTSGTTLVVGQEILIDYQHDENFVVDYQSNSLVSLAQSSIDADRHVTADVLTKEAIPIGVDIHATVVLQKGQSVPTVDGFVRTNLARLFGTLSLGQPLRQSDVIGAIDSASGVSYVVSPLTKLCKSDDSIVVREEIPTDQSGVDSVLISSWGTNLVDTYLLTQKLTSGTPDSGGEINDFRGVFADEVLLSNNTVAPNNNGVPLKNSINGSFIIGNDGLWIPGYSDDVTLQVLYPFASAGELADKRMEITQDRILVTVSKGSLPEDVVYQATYVVYGDSGVKNIETGPTEYLILGDLEFVYDEDTDYSALVAGRRR
jgi:hypothetical protein